MTYSAPGSSINEVIDPTLFHTSGTYVGNAASGSHTCGFQPRLIIVAADVTTSSRNGGIKNASLASNAAIATSGGATTGITITSTGFMVDAGAQFNYTGVNYYFNAFK